MSTQNRSTGARKASKLKVSSNNTDATAIGEAKDPKDKAKVSSTAAEQTKPEKEKVLIKPTPEQIRIAQITDIKGGIEDPKIREKVTSLMEMTERSEEDVCCALYECDNDMDRAVIFLLEQLPVGAFATTSKKKKNKSKEENNAGGDSDWNNENAAPNNSAEGRDKGRNRLGGVANGGASNAKTHSRNASGNDRGGRERKRDDRNSGAGGDFKVDTFRSGTDRERGKAGPRGSAPSGGTRAGGRGGRGPPNATSGRSNYREGRSRNIEHQEIDSWDATQGIIADKQKEVPIDTWGDWDNEEYTSKVFTAETSGTSNPANQSDLLAPPGLEPQILNSSASAQQIDSYSSAISANVSNVSSSSQPQYSDIHSGSTTAAQQLRQALELPQIQSTTLSAEQSQYFSTLSSQNGGSGQYSAAAAFGGNQYGVNEHANQRSRRARVPPPSKIPSSAVEMPGDNLSNIGYLDVQFGGLDFGTDDSFDQVTDKFRDALDTQQPSLSVAEVGDFASKAASQGGAMTANALQASAAQLLANSDNIVHSDTISSRSVNNGVTANNSAFSLNKPDSYITQGNAVTGGYQSGSFSSNAKVPSYQQNVHNVYGTSSYANAQNANYTPVTNNSYNSFNQSTGGAFQQSSATSGTGATVANSVAQNSSANPNNQAHSNSQNTNSSASYLSNQYSASATTGYTSQQNLYQSNQAFGNSGLSANTGSNSSTTNTSITTASLTSPSLGLTNSKSTSSTAKSGSAAVVPNIPMVSQYIQTPGMPFYQPQVYSYEDLQMIQPRVSHMPGYYDLNYQTPTSLGAAGVREGNLGSVAYSTMSDARFTRTDNNSSPVSNVPSTISQQTGSGGPMLNLPYAYFYSGNAMMPGGFQYGAPAIYPQQMATANATSGGQFAKPSYSSSYGSSTYDNLTQGSQDYGKTTYNSGGGVGQTKPQAPANNQSGGNSGSEIFGKGHAALGKSYENKSFHSGTPPPFNLVGSQTALNSASAQPYGSQHLYIPTLAAPHHNINMHQPHQDSSRQQSTNQGKSGNKQGYSPSYWTAQS